MLPVAGVDSRWWSGFSLWGRFPLVGWLPDAGVIPVGVVISVVEMFFIVEIFSVVSTLRAFTEKISAQTNINFVQADINSDFAKLSREAFP